MQEKGENIPTTIKENTLQRINNNEWKVQVLSQQVLVLGKGALGFPVLVFVVVCVFPCLSIWFSVLIKTTTVDPLFNEVPRDWENWFVISRKNNLDVRYIEVWLIIALFFCGVTFRYLTFYDRNDYCR